MPPNRNNDDLDSVTVEELINLANQIYAHQPKPNTIVMCPDLYRSIVEAEEQSAISGKHVEADRPNGIPIIVDGQRVGDLEPMEYRGAREVAPIYTIPDDIVAAQPMTAPASLMFYMDFKYPNPPNYKDRWEWIWEEINAEED